MIERQVSVVNKAFTLQELEQSKSPIFNLWQTSQVLSAEKERKGPAEEALQAYTAHMKEILSRNGLLK